MVAATETGGLSDQTFWTNQAAMTLAALLYAAGLEDLSLEHVDAWTLNEDPTPLKILTRPRPGHNTSRAAALVRRYHNLHVRTRDSIYLTLRQVLRCMDDPDIAHLLCPPAGEGLDLETFLRQRGTLYLISGDSTHPATPLLFATLISEIHHQARTLASPRPNRRMDPPVTFVLDEAPEICPIPQLPGWIATAAGSGFVFIIAGQSWSQFQHRWSEHGATTIWNNCKAKMLFGATSDPHDLKVMSDLAGEITLPYREKTVDSSGKPYYTRRWETVPVLPPDHARRLPTWRALVVRRNATPTIVRTEQVWKRADYKRWKTKDGTIPFLPLTPTPPAPTPATTQPSTDDSATPPPTRQPRSSRPWHIKRPDLTRHDRPQHRPRPRRRPHRHHRRPRRRPRAAVSHRHQPDHHRDGQSHRSSAPATTPPLVLAQDAPRPQSRPARRTRRLADPGALRLAHRPTRHPALLAPPLGRHRRNLHAVLHLEDRLPVGGSNRRRRRRTPRPVAAQRSGENRDQTAPLQPKPPTRRPPTRRHRHHRGRPRRAALALTALTANRATSCRTPLGALFISGGLGP
ncbi:Basic proline-rich protein precursor [[Actinomadura] parvosata subsp. kistnae]|nr:Basic proline-rich protein precursor [Actinomadura parvosata subsp. kistnae]